MSCTDHTRRTPYASIRAVRVLLDYRPALRARTGVGEYAHQVTCALAALRRDADDEVVAFSSSWKDRLVPPCPGVTVADARVPVRCLNLLWHHVGWPPVERFAGRVDVAHSITPLLVPARTARQVVTVHDLFFLDHPDATSAEIRRDYPRLVRSHAQRADLVVTPSHHVSALVVERLDVDPGRVLTCPGGAPRWTARPSVPAEGPVIFLGTLEPRKNVHLLLDAWTILAGRGGPVPTLLLAGGPGPDAEAVAARIAQPPLAGHVRHVGYLPDTEREAFYRQARLLVMPSLDEGFGLPAIEACAAGVPVLASRCGALPEVGGDAPVYLDPRDPDAWADAVAALLADPAQLEAMRQRGVARAAAFSWDRTAAALWQAYRGLVGGAA
jgi:glycosyltransferase involved in cell wall biosynthesis